MHLRGPDFAGQTPPRPQRHSGRGVSSTGGFTLVEVLVSVIFLTIAFLTLVSVIAAGRASVKKAYYTVRAASATANVIEGYQGEGHDGISGTSTWVVSDLPSGNSTVGQVTAYDCVTNSAGLKMVTVKTAWPGSAGAGYTGGQVVFATLIADRSSESDYRLQRGY
jgi:Tfp pilus assembly protein PilV